eukprot:m.182805 g.182805  ORF g.182805 m.182805 type:complete len:575 (-) comp15383_c0_seq1:128-1852(-)
MNASALIYFVIFTCVNVWASGEPLRSNVVLLLLDDVGYGDIQYGDASATSPAFTPHLVEMARAPSTIHMRRFYSGAAVCAPTRSSMLTGRTPTRECIITVEQNPLPSALATSTTAAYAKNKGYATGFFGKWHLGSLSSAIMPDCQRRPENGSCTPGYILENNTWCCDGRDSHVPVMRPTDVGFETALATPQVAATSTANCGCVGTVPGAGHGCNLGHYQGIGHIPAEQPWLECNQYFHADMSRGGNANMQSVREVAPLDDAEYLVDNFIRFAIEAWKQSKPFFAQISFHNNHIPYVAPPRYRALYRKYSPNEQDYYGSLTAVDAQIGRLRRFLRHAGLANNTLVALTSDNGPEDNIGDHECAVFPHPGSTAGLLGRKRTLTEGGIRVPALIEFPRLIHENRVEPGHHPASTSDFLPPLMDIIGAAPTHPDWPLDGVSLLPLLAGNVTHRASPMGWYSAFPWALLPSAPPPLVECATRPHHPLPRNFPADFATPFNQPQLAWSEGELKMFACNPTPRNASNWRFSLYDVVTDEREENDLWPELRDTKGSAMFGNFLTWQASVLHSIASESRCTIP